MHSALLGSCRLRKPRRLKRKQQPSVSAQQAAAFAKRKFFPSRRMRLLKRMLRFKSNKSVVLVRGQSALLRLGTMSGTQTPHLADDRDTQSGAKEVLILCDPATEDFRSTNSKGELHNEEVFDHSVVPSVHPDVCSGRSHKSAVL